MSLENPPVLRPEQLAAVEKTLKYYNSEKSPREFLWNCKPRFGKTIAAYEFVKRINARRVLIITNRPAISDSWEHDYKKFLAGTDYKFFTSRSEQIKSRASMKPPFIFFISLQDIKGKIIGDFKKKNKWIYELKDQWDLVIIDESHEGIKTKKSYEVFSRIPSKFTLYLSGTPFRAIADQDFREDQIISWTYLDDQKLEVPRSPRLNFYTADLVDFLGISSVGLPGADLVDSPGISSTDANHLFDSTSAGFKDPKLVGYFLDRLATIYESFPGELDHTFWLLPGVKECKNLEKLLLENKFFKNYHVVVAAGKASGYAFGKKSLENVRAAIRDHKKTITLSCGQLSTGVTVPEWTATFMLYSSSDLSRLSESLYLQAVFRTTTSSPGKMRSLIFDFNPARLEQVLKSYAENLCAGSQDFWHYIDLYTLGGSAWHKVELEKLSNLANLHIARKIVDGLFISSDELFNLGGILSLPDSALDIINRAGSIHKSRREKNPPKISHAEIKNLAAIESVLLSGEEKYNFSNFSPAKEAAIKVKQTELRESARLSAHKKYHDLLSRYHDRLRSIASAFPLLIHLYGAPGTNLENIVRNAPDEVLAKLVGLSKNDLIELISAGCFNLDNFNLAANEFIKRRDKAGDFYKQPVLSTILDLMPPSSEDIFTPCKVVEKMLDILEAENPNIFKNKHAKFLDVASKSGNFAAGVIRRLYKDERSDFDSDSACLAHIYSEQIYLVPTNSFTEEVIKKSLPRLKNIHKMDNSPDDIKNLEEEIKKQWGNDMKFDVIISNPPYEKGRRQIYADFYKLAVDLNPDLVCMVFPRGWQKPYNHNGLGTINNEFYKRDRHLVFIDNYDEASSAKLFPGIATGGVNIVLRDLGFDNGGRIKKLTCGCPDGYMNLPITKSELDKPAELTGLIDLLADFPKMEALGSPRKPYGFHADPLRHPEKYGLKLSVEKKQKDDVRLFGLLPDTTRGYRYIPAASLPKATRCLKTYKIFVPKAWGNMAENIGLGGSYANIVVARPGDVCSETFIEFGPFRTRAEAIKMAKYFMTKFFRALLFLAKDSQNTARDKYRFIPVVDVSTDIWQQSIDMIDEYLFDYYNLPEKTRDFIRKNIQARSEANIEII